jgi:hypothetical protein
VKLLKTITACVIILKYFVTPNQEFRHTRIPKKKARKKTTNEIYLE